MSNVILSIFDHIVSKYPEVNPQIGIGHDGRKGIVATVSVRAKDLEVSEATLDSIRDESLAIVKADSYSLISNVVVNLQVSDVENIEDLKEVADKLREDGVIEDEIDFKV